MNHLERSLLGLMLLWAVSIVGFGVFLLVDALFKAHGWTGIMVSVGSVIALLGAGWVVGTCIDWWGHLDPGPKRIRKGVKRS